MQKELLTDDQLRAVVEKKYIADTRNIKYVVLDGKLVDRQSLVANKSNQTSGSE